MATKVSAGGRWRPLPCLCLQPDHPPHPATTLLPLSKSPSPLLSSSKPSINHTEENRLASQTHFFPIVKPKYFLSGCNGGKVSYPWRGWAWSSPLAEPHSTVADPAAAQPQSANLYRPCLPACWPDRVSQPWSRESRMRTNRLIWWSSPNLVPPSMDLSETNALDRRMV